MAYTLDRVVAAPPETVLAAIRDSIPATRTSDIPRELRRTLLPVLRGRVRKHRFTVYLHGMDESSTNLSGYVLPMEDGGCRVVGDVAEDRHPERGGLIFLGMAALIAVSGGEGAVVMVIVAILVSGLGWLFRDWNRVDAEQARFLLAWLNRVLDGVLEAFPPPPVPSRIEARGEAPASADDASPGLIQ